MKKKSQLMLPEDKHKLLLHSCCAPCAGDIMEQLLEVKIDYSIYFYNPNIHPQEEYILRKEENIKFAKQLGVRFIDADYDVQNWFERAKGMEHEPERGIRCTMCFDMRFYKTAQYAQENQFDIISSTLGISRWKDMEQINQAGIKAASVFSGIDYWTFNWRKQGGSARMLDVSKREEFYQQQYCGCVYSRRDTNKWRLSKGRKAIQEEEIKFYRHS